MTLKITKGNMWRAEIEDKAGTFAHSLEPFAKAKQNLQIVSGWSGMDGGKGAVKLFPITDEKAKQCARDAGLAEMKEAICLIVEGKDRPGMAYDMAKAIADAGINLRFAMCQGIHEHFVACFGFQNDADAEKARTALSRL